jgi:ribosome-associated protein
MAKPTSKTKKSPAKPAKKSATASKGAKAAVKRPQRKPSAPKSKPAPAKAVPKPKPDPAREQLMRLVGALLDKKGQAVTSVKVGGVVGYTDYYLIATGTSTKHNQTLCDAIVESETKSGHPKPRREGYNLGNWIVVDAGDIIVHLFDDASRHYYDLERLFLDSERRLYGEDGKIVDLPRMGKGA